jgi:hypothetical protein
VSSALSTGPAQGYEFIGVVVDEVDAAARSCSATDRTGAVLQVSFRDQSGGVAYVPSPGERWVAVRRGYQWFLDRRMDSEDEGTALAAYEPGDMRISAPGTIRVEAQQMTLNGAPLGATVTDEFEDPASGFASVALSEDADEQSIQVYLNGLLTPTAAWTYDAPTRALTFSPALGEVGFLVAVYRPSSSP